MNKKRISDMMGEINKMKEQKKKKPEEILTIKP